VEAVDAAREGLFAWGTARFVRAEYLRDITEGLCLAADLVLEETFLEGPCERWM